MKTYFPDTNIFLRFFLKDNLKQFTFAKNFLNRAKQKKIKAVVLPEIFFEINYVLQKVYHLKKEEVIKIILQLSKTTYLEIIHREIVISSLNLFRDKNLDLIDCYLYYFAISQKAEVFSFDRDFQKIVINN